MESILEQNLIKIQSIIFRYSKLAISIFSMIIFAFIYESTSPNYAIRSLDWLDKGLDSTKRLIDFNSDFGQEEKLVWIPNISIENSTQFCDLQKYLKSIHFTNFNISKISSIFDVRRVEVIKSQKLFYPLIFNRDCEFSDIDFSDLKSHPLSSQLSLLTEFKPLVYFEFDKDVENKSFGSIHYNEVKKIIENLNQVIPNSWWGGSVMFQVSVIDGLKWNQILNIFIGILVIFCCWLFWGNIFTGIYLMLIVSLTNYILKSVMGTFLVPIDPLNASLFALLTLAIIEDCYFLFYEIHRQTNLKVSMSEACRSLVYPCFLTSLTTIIGFGSLAFTNNKSLIHFGTLASLGAFIEWFLLFIIFPCLFNMFPKLNDLIKPKKIKAHQFLSFFARFQLPKTPVIGFISVLILLPIAWYLPNLNYSPFDMFKDNHELIKYRNKIFESENYEGVVYLTIPIEYTDSKRVQVVKKISALSDVKSVFDPLTSIHEMIPKDVIQPIQDLIVRELKSTSVFKNYFSSEKIKITLNLKSMDLKSLNNLQLQIDNICSPECVLNGEAMTFKDYALSILNSLYFGFFISLFLVTLLILLLSRIKLGKFSFPLFISTIWAPCVFLILISVFQIKINVVTCVALAILIGVAGDNGIQFLFNYRNSNLKKSIHEKGAISIAIFINMLVISLALLGSYFKSTQTLSGLLVGGVILILIGDLWILNTLLGFKKPINSQDC